MTKFTTFLSKEIAATEESLHKLLRKQQKLQQQADNDDDDDDDINAFDIDNPDGNNVIQQLIRLQGTADTLVLAQDYIDFLERSAENDNSDVFGQARLCTNLADAVLLKHGDDILQLCPPLYEEVYIPLFHYVHEYLVTMLRQELQASRYPHPKGCATLMHQGPQGRLAQICHSMTKLENTHGQVLQSVEGVTNSSGPNDTVLLELFHPLLDRIQYHFVSNDEAQKEGKPATSTRIDRLPEWLLKYVRENVLGTEDDNDNDESTARPYHVIRMVDPFLTISFGCELVRLIQWVLVEQRNFFNDAAVAGPKSNPQCLYNAIQEFLEFDVVLKRAICSTGGGLLNSNDSAAPPIMVPQNNSFLGVMDVLVVSNMELLDWWIERERESLFSTLFPDDDEDKDNDAVPKPLANHVSPRAEIFCALIRSVQFKAATLTAPGKYLRGVGVPLCSSFVDAIHETSVDLSNLLKQKQPESLVMESQIIKNVHEWIEIINGTVLASRVLLAKERTWHYENATATMSSQSDHDLARFGRSLERLADVMVEEFATTFVEVILMERAKFASYLMMASHLLASEEWEAEELESELSVELKDTKVVLMYFHQVCNSILRGHADIDNQSRSSENFPGDSVAFFGPSKMRAHVMNQIAEKFLEVALDINHVTPDIWSKGAAIFARDVYSVVGMCQELPSVVRLLEVTKLMTINIHAARGLFSALGGLVGTAAFLDIEEFFVDETLNEQAVSMLKAKNINCPLEDAISILNRRR